MKSFSYKANYNENENIERIITERNRKLAKQQIVFTIVLLLVLILLAWYLFRKVVYSEFDGYVQTEYKDYRAIEDIYLFDQYTDVGDVVIPGDTLYSFIFVNLFGVGNLESEPAVIANDRNARIQAGIAYADAEVLRVRIRELEKQIELEDNNIRFGLTDNSHKMDLERLLAEARQQLRAANNKAYLYSRMSRESNAAARRFGQYSIDFAHEQWGLDEALHQLYERNSSAIRYAIAQDTAIVTKLWAPPFSRVFKKERILQLENVSFDHSNMQVVAYVPTNDMRHVNNNTQAEIIVNDEVSFTATVKLLGARTEDLPEELRNSLSHNYTAVMVVFKPDAGQVLPLWAVVDRVPVKVRVNNFNNGLRNDGSDYWYINQDGLTEESSYYLGLTRHRKGIRHAYDPTANYPDGNAAHATAPEAEAAKTEAPEAKPAAKTETAAKAEPAKAEPAKTESAKAEPVKKSVNTAYRRHKVEAGETLYSISRRYGVPIDTIVSHNPGTDKRLVAGSTIKIPENEIKKRQ